MTESEKGKKELQNKEFYFLQENITNIYMHKQHSNNSLHLVEKYTFNI